MYESSSLLVLCIIFVVTRLPETNSAQNRFHSLEPHHCVVSFPNPIALSEVENLSNHCQYQRKMGKKVLDCVVIDKLVLPVLQQHLALRGILQEFANIECWVERNAKGHCYSLTKGFD